ncbi:MAG: hypothetical protein HOH96_08130 [Flavobacteriales bacterium]|jgi:hypothetical protein|nr:hypothetical protein [Flavobacteriales bacterium]
MSPGVSKAVIYTLAVHAVTLFIFTQITVSDTTPLSEQFTSIEFFDPSELPESEKSLEELFREKLNERISNLRADASAETSSESRSTGLSASELAALEAAVASELADLESSEFERLSSEEIDFETVGVPESAEDSQREIDTMDDWDKQYEGRVTVRFDLDARSPRHLDVPGYKCKGRADIVVNISVSASGEVLSAELVSGASDGSCFALAALRSALASEFLPLSSAPRRQEGTLSYAFVAQ